ELAELKKEQSGLKKLLGSPAERRRMAAQEVREDSEKFGDKRRTFIEEAERITVSMVETVTDEPVTLLLSKNGFLRSRQGHGIDRAALSWKEGDAPLAIVETRTVHPIVAMGANGRAYNLKASDLPGGKGDGVPMSSLADTQGTAIVALISTTLDQAVLFASSAGYALSAKVESLITRQRAGKAFVTIGEGDALITAALMPANVKEVAALSGEGRLLVFPIDEVAELANGGRGVTAIKLHANEKMLGLKAVQPEGVRIGTFGRGDKRSTMVLKGAALARYRGNRARTGRVLEGTHKRVEGFED
ncbi:MAG: DNA gyrase C-terminal beta-propeller domain-containing protein, partial [Usitatibacter sp.]